MKLSRKSGRLFALALITAGLFFSLTAMAQEAIPPAAAKMAHNGETSFQLRQMIANGWPILSVLLIMSVVSISIMIERAIVVKRAERDANSFLPEVKKALASGKPLAEIIAFCGSVEHRIATMLANVLAEHGNREAMERVSQREIQKEIGQLEAKIPALGTIASTAPFVGLLGTVVGIIKAFQSIATHKGGGPEVVAAGVAEALITTAFGLFVAIPAVMAYNHFSHRIQKFAADTDVSVSEISDKLNKLK